MFVIVRGTPSKGFEFIGPFKEKQDAYEHITATGTMYSSTPWEVTQMVNPEDEQDIDE